MEKGKATYLVNPDIEIMSLVELGANYTQTEDGKTILLMKSAKRIAQENSTGKGKEMTELEKRKRALELELAQVNDELSKEGEVVDGDKKPEDAGEEPVEPEKPKVEEPADGGAQAPDPQGKVTELEAALAAKDEEIADWKKKYEELVDISTEYFTPASEQKPEGDA